MNESSGIESQEPKPAPPERFIPERPRLRHIEKTISILESEVGPDEKEINWKDLHEKIGPWNSVSELSERIQAVTQDYVAAKLPKLREEIPPVGEVPEKDFLVAISNGWFEELGEDVVGTRKEVLFAVLAQISKRIETKAYTDILKNASDEELQKLGLSENLRDLAVDTMNVAIKSNPLFIRFLAYSQLAKRPPAEASPFAPMGTDGKPHTWRELFPKESNFIAKRLEAIHEGRARWEGEPGAGEFADYIKCLGEFFAETDVLRASEAHQAMKAAYVAVMKTPFPIGIIPPLEGYYKPPHLDPELRVVFSAPHSKLREKELKPLQEALAGTLDSLGVGQFSEPMKARAIRSFVSVGAYGVGLVFNAEAQEEPVAMFYENEQKKVYENIGQFFDLLESSSDASAGVERRRVQEELPRREIGLHEFSHAVYPIGTPEADRLGPEAESVLGEVMAESVYRGVAGELIQSGAINSTREHYAALTIALSLKSMAESESDDEYFQAAAFVLNGLAERGTVAFTGQKIHVADTDAFFAGLTENARAIIALYEDKNTNPRRAEQWIQKNCTPGEKLQKMIDRAREVIKK